MILTTMMLPLCLKKEMKELVYISVMFFISTCIFTAGLGFQIFKEGYIFNSMDSDDGGTGQEKLFLDNIVFPD